MSKTKTVDFLLFLFTLHVPVGPFAKVIYYLPSQIYAKIPSRT